MYCMYCVCGSPLNRHRRPEPLAQHHLPPQPPTAAHDRSADANRLARGPGPGGQAKARARAAPAAKGSATRPSPSVCPDGGGRGGPQATAGPLLGGSRKARLSAARGGLRGFCCSAAGGRGRVKEMGLSVRALLLRGIERCAAARGRRTGENRFDLICGWRPLGCFEQQLGSRSGLSSCAALTVHMKE